MENVERIKSTTKTESEQRQSLRHGLRAVTASLRTVDMLLTKTPGQTETRELLHLCQLSLNDMIEQLRDPSPDDSLAMNSASEKKLVGARESRT
jgi:hypothetical protein